MNLKITGKQSANITEPMREYLTSKLSFLDKYINENDLITVNISIERKNHKITSFLTYMGQPVTIKMESNDFYLTAEKMADTLKRNLLKIHDMKTDKGNPKISTEYKMFVEVKNKKENNDELKITKRKRFGLKPMSEKEAMLQMDKLGHESFLFANVDIDTDNMGNYITCLLFRRKDNSFGIIEGYFDDEE